MSKDSLTSPEGGKEGCLCADNTYSNDCCNGELLSQAVGPLIGLGISNVINISEERTIISVSK